MGHFKMGGFRAAHFLSSEFRVNKTLQVVKSGQLDLEGLMGNVG